MSRESANAPTPARRTGHQLAAVMILIVLVAACAPERDDPHETTVVARAESAIINGSPDTDHPAVVAYLQGGKCSATIVHVDGSNGYALTAAHCISGQNGKLRQGENHANGQFDVEYSVVEKAIHPNYVNTNEAAPEGNQSALWDFAMLRFSGATGSTPVIPAMQLSEDSLKSGDQVDLVGYGQTESSGNNKERRHKVLPIDAETELRLFFDQATGGMCFGDSGGGAIAQIGGEDRVAGVHSGVSDETCGGTASRVRVSAVVDTFITPFVTGAPFGEQSCDQCNEAATADGVCGDDLAACFDSAACQSYLSCAQACSSGVCVKGCQLTHSAGFNQYDAIFDCVCSDGCSSECGGDPLCAADPVCGLGFVNDACNDCVTQSCCAEASACDGDLTCWECSSVSGPLVGCSDNEPYQALQACLGTGCSDECGVQPPTSTTGAGGGSTTVAGATAGVGGGGVSAGGASPEDDSTGDEVQDIVATSTCGVDAAGVPSARGWWGLLGLVALARRRRRH